MIEFLSMRNKIQSVDCSKRLWDLESHGLVFPIYPKKLGPGNPFAYLRNSIVSSQSFVKILWISIFNVTRTQIDDILPVRNESILIRCLHLIIISMQSSSDFVALVLTLGVSLSRESVFATSREKEGYNLLQLLLDLLSRGHEEFLVGVVPLLKFILNQYTGLSSIIDPWREAMIAKTTSLEKEDTAKRRKKDAKARMAKIKSGFVKTQSLFVDNNQLDPTLSAPSDENQSSNWRYPTGNCVICSEELGENSALYGSMAFLQAGDIERGFAGVHVGSCGHLIHSRCFKVYWTDLVTVCA
jgi:hypothetical protein